MTVEPIKGPLEIVEYRVDPNLKTVVWGEADEGHRVAMGMTFRTCCIDIVRPWDRDCPPKSTNTYGSSIGAIICSIPYQLSGSATREQALANAQRLVSAYNLYEEMKKVSENVVPLIEKNIDYPYPNDRELTKSEVMRAIFIVGVSYGFVHHLKKWFNIPTTQKSEVMETEKGKGR